MSIEQPILTPAQKDEITSYVNAYRARHGSPPLKWDDTIANFSQKYSYYLVSNNLFQHSNNELYGENLAYFQGQGNNMMELIKKSIDLWYDEIKLYNFNNPGYSPGTGHFTCLVWKSSTTFGMGYSYNTQTQIADITQNTAPPGNIIGQFQENVLPKTIEITPTPMPEPEPEQESDNGNIPETLMPTNGDEFDDDEQEEGEEELNPELVEKLSKIISGMYNVIQMIQTRKNAYTIRLFLLQIANVVREVKEDEFPEKMRILSSIYNLISVIRRRYSRYVAVRYIANMIYKLEQFLMASYTK